MKRTDYRDLILGLIPLFDPPAVAVHGDTAGLEGIYAQLPGRFPKLYERLLLSYQWEDVDLSSILRKSPAPRSPSRSVRWAVRMKSIH